MCIGTSSYLFSSSIILTLGLYFRKQSFTLYTVITTGKAIKISNYATGKAVIVKLGSAVSRVVSY